MGGFHGVSDREGGEVWRNSKWGDGLSAPTCMSACRAVTAATCPLFRFKAAGVKQVLWQREQERSWVS